MNDGCAKLAPKEEDGPIIQEMNRLERTVTQLERELESLGNKIHSTLSDPVPATAGPEEATPTCELASNCRAIQARVQVMVDNAIDWVQRCQL